MASPVAVGDALTAVKLRRPDTPRRHGSVKAVQTTPLPIYFPLPLRLSFSINVLGTPNYPSASFAHAFRSRTLHQFP